MEYYSSREGWVKVSDIKELAIALAKAQGDIDNVKKTSTNPGFRSKYANLAAVWDTIREELSKNGLSVVQFPIDAPNGSPEDTVGLKTILLHSSGQYLEATFSMPVKDAKNPQAVGSALTYARRYALMAVVGIAPEDDDGNAASGTKPKPGAAPTPDQTDWAKAAKDTLDHALNATASAADVRGTYAKVRNSPMPEPAKTQLLAALTEIISGKS